MADEPVKPTDPIMSPVRAQRDRVEQDGASSTGSDHLAHAQRAYLYALHGASGVIAIALPASALLCGAALIVSRSAPSSRTVSLTMFSLCVLAWFVWARGMRLFLAGDPAYRMSGALFLVRKSIMPAALLVAFAAGVITAGRISSAAQMIAPLGLLLVLVGAGAVWLIIAIAWRTRSLLGRCAAGREAIWSDLGALALVVAACAMVIVTSLSASALTNILLVAASIIALLGSLATALALLRLRSRVGGIMRDMERAEPGPAFEPVAPGS